MAGMHHYVLLLIGIAILLLGRKLFWLSVAAIGFVIGVQMAPSLFPHQAEIYVLAFGLFLGILGAVLALFLQGIAIALAGFVFGSHLGMALATALSTGGGDNVWIFAIAGGVIGAVVMIAFFDWALIILSSLVGAHLIVDAIRMNSSAKLVCFVVLVVAGIVIQASLPGRRRIAEA